MKRTSMVGQVTCGLMAMAWVAAANAQQPAAFSPYIASAGLQSEPFAARPVAKPAAGEEENSPDTPGGIKIHGHWVIDIKNSDGTLDRHLDFENSLTTGGGAGTDFGVTGDQIIAALLSGAGVASAPGIGFIQAPSPGTTVPTTADITSLCNPNIVSGYVCGVLTTAQSPQSAFSGYAASVQNGLAETASFSGTVNLVLTGNFTVPNSMTQLTAVQTLMAVCYTNAAINNNRSLTGSVTSVTGATAPTACTLANYNAAGTTPNGSIYETFGSLTQAIVPGAPQTVTAGQVITVTVKISFS